MFSSVSVKEAWPIYLSVLVTACPVWLSVYKVKAWPISDRNLNIVVVSVLKEERLELTLMGMLGKETNVMGMYGVQERTDYYRFSEKNGNGSVE